MVDSLDAFRESYSQWWKDSIDMLVSDMTTDMVEYIKKLRCIDDYSWRSVAQEFCLKYPKFAAEYNLYSSNQVTGMQLCEAAQKVLNEKLDDGWN
jgi:hypothetical protein